MGAAAFAFIAIQRRQSGTIRGINRELETTNEFLAALSMKISRYLSPQVYKSIFSGQKDVIIHTERKKLTIFFSDIKDFTATTERLQPELITQLLNEYFTEMSNIALAHGGTVDKFIGDAILIFFGDPETKGEAEDAKACLRMAADMQRKLAELNVKWRGAGIEHPFQARMGINTGFCNVGNFGSADRMDYTIIGAEANLAARLQSIAEPGHIVISYETYALVRDMVVAHALPPITMKGISREVIPSTHAWSMPARRTGYARCCSRRSQRWRSRRPGCSISAASGPHWPAPHGFRRGSTRLCCRAHPDVH
jgi:class 3 adenylate cyclase